MMGKGNASYCYYEFPSKNTIASGWSIDDVKFLGNCEDNALLICDSYKQSYFLFCLQWLSWESHDGGGISLQNFIFQIHLILARFVYDVYHNTIISQNPMHRLISYIYNRH